MDSRKYLWYGAGWVGAIVGMFAYSLLAGVFGVEWMYQAVRWVGIIMIIVAVSAFWTSLIG